MNSITRKWRFFFGGFKHYWILLYFELDLDQNFRPNLKEILAAFLAEGLLRRNLWIHEELSAFPNLQGPVIIIYYIYNCFDRMWEERETKIWTDKAACRVGGSHLQILKLRCFFPRAPKRSINLQKASMKSPSLYGPQNSLCTKLV